MAWKIERWLSEVFPGEQQIFAEYEHLNRRELAVVAAGVLDIAVAELLSRRLIDNPKEYEEFLGLNEDGRAPCASFGARIQLALLLGIISKDDAAILRTIKNIRNKFAHRVKVDFTSEDVKPLVLKLHERFRSLLQSVDRTESKADGVDQLRPYLDMTPEAGAALLLSVLSVYQAYFLRLSSIVDRVDKVVRPERVVSDHDE